MTDHEESRELLGFLLIMVGAIVLGTALGLGLATLTEDAQTHRYEIRLEHR